MATFRKYAFTSEAAYNALPTPDGNAVPLGEINKKQFNHIYKHHTSLLDNEKRK